MLFAPVELNPYLKWAYQSQKHWRKRRKARLLEIVAKHHPTATPEEIEKIVLVINIFENEQSGNWIM